MNKRRKDWAIWDTVFLVPLVVVNLMPRGQGIDAAHALAGAAFRLLVSVICLIGFITIQVLKRRPVRGEPPLPWQQPLAPWEQPPYAPATPAAISIEYNNTREYSWRAEKYALFHQPATLSVLCFFGLATAFLMDMPIYHWGAAAGITAFPFLAVLGFAIWAGLFLLAVHLLLNKRFPHAGSVRSCTTSLTSAGVVDETPDKHQLIEWGIISSIRMHQGDFILWTSAGTGIFVPREGFASLDDGEKFFTAANMLWKSQGAAWFEAAGLHTNEAVGAPTGDWEY